LAAGFYPKNLAFARKWRFCPSLGGCSPPSLLAHTLMSILSQPVRPTGGLYPVSDSLSLSCIVVGDVRTCTGERKMILQSPSFYLCRQVSDYTRVYSTCIKADLPLFSSKGLEMRILVHYLAAWIWFCSSCYFLSMLYADLLTTVDYDNNNWVYSHHGIIVAMSACIFWW